jgi:hypothetical protein
MNFRLIFAIILCQTTFFLFAQENFAGNSILRSGKWYKIKVEEGGIYKLSFDKLVEIGFESPENIRIYSNSGGQLPLKVEGKMQDDLNELPLYQPSGSNYFLFYAEGPNLWQYNSADEIFERKINDFATENYLFLTTSLGPGKRVADKDYSASVATSEVSSFSWRGVYEEDLINLIRSGRDWFGMQYKNVPFEYTFSISNIVLSEDIKIKVRTAVRSENGDNVIFSFNSVNIDTVYFGSVNMSNDEKTHALASTNTYIIPASQQTNVFRAEAINYGINNKAYMDYVLLNTRCQLKYNGSPLYFRDIESFKDGGIARFKLSNANSRLQVWNISKQDSVFALKGNLNGSNFEFKSPVNDLSEFVAFDIQSDYPSPVFSDESRNDLGWIENQNLHALTSPELLIVSHPLFLDAADSLAQLHRILDNMTVEVVTTTQVYNEFSSGKADAGAIRNFARMLWDRSSETNKFKYLLLFGDGSFDNRTYNEVNSNYIPTFQNDESLTPLDTYSTDDFYAMLEPGEWAEKGSLEIGVGRLPVYWTEDKQDKTAWDFIKKIKIYYGEDVKRDWRNKMIFLADDMDDGWESSFVTDSEKLIDIVQTDAPEMNITKIYLDAFTQISSSTGPSYPDGENAIQEAFNKGAILFSYMGHGGETGITQEKVLQTSDFEKLSNAPYFPIFLTATCQVSRYDDVDIEGNNYTRTITAGETALLNPNGGAIAMFTTTRVVFQTRNFELSKSFFENMFNVDENGDNFRLGDLYRIAKNENKQENARKFTLLGDPAINVPFGKYRVITDSINEISVLDGIDTVSAFGKVSVSGHLEYPDSTILDNFDGIVQVSVYDKEYVVSTKANDPGSEEIEFNIQDRLLFHGNASVNSGYFSFEFIVPKDISYNFGEGKITYYAYNSETDAKGCFENFIIGGTAENIEDDIDGPEIELFINNEDFADGGITDPNPILLAKLFDVNGINTTGIGIGHDVSAFIDDDFSDVVTLNDYFDGAVDDYRSGLIRYQLQDLETGYHTINVKVWDTYNNSSQDEIGFYVKSGDQLIMDKLYSYPNPMSFSTTFQYSHNMPGMHDIRLEIYDLSGKKIYEYSVSNQENGFVSQPINWNINSTSTHIEPGVYVYRLNINVISDTDGLNYSTSQTNKLIIIP